MKPAIFTVSSTEHLSLFMVLGIVVAVSTFLEICSLLNLRPWIVVFRLSQGIL